MNTKINKKITLLLVIIFSVIAFLRLFSISKFPSSLYWEEAALGYDAYSILKTGKDFHGKSFPIVAFESFGDYKPSGYVYFTVLSEKFLGLTPLAIRLPSVIAGALISIFAYLISLEIFSSHKKKRSIGLVSATLIGFSPWAFQFSRAAFEANLATAFSLVATWFLLKSQKNKSNLFGSVIFFSLSLYTYHSSRIFIPFLLLGYLLSHLKSVIANWKHWIMAGIFGLILIFPILTSLNKPEVKHRFQETSAFTSLDPIIKINQQRAEHNNSIPSRITYHRYWYYTNTVIKNISTNFNLNYLFISGDENKRHSTGESGIFYPLDAILLIFGLLALLKLKSRKSKLLIIWWLAALVPASLTKTNPHALRTLVALPAPQIIAAFGAINLSTHLKKYKRTLITIFILLSSLIFRHFYNYFNAYTKIHSPAWQYGYQELMEIIKENQNDYDQIYITNNLGRPSIYHFFYNQVDPTLVQNEELDASKDQGERLSFQNIYFQLPQQVPPNSLIVTTKMINSDKDQEILYLIKDLLDQPIFYVYQQ